MNPIQVRQRFVAALATDHFTTLEDMQRIVKIGTLAYAADRFYDLVGRTLGISALNILDEFYRNFLGSYIEVAEDTADGNYSLRFFRSKESSPKEIEGVQISFVYDGGLRRYRARVYKVRTTPSGVVGLSLLQVFEVGASL